MKSRLLKQIASFALVLFVVTTLVLTPAFLLGSSETGVAHAQFSDPGDIFDPGGYLGDTPLPDDDLRSLTISIINILLGILGIIFLLLILYGGFLWMTSAGSEERAANGRKIIGNGIVGLIVIFVAFAITTFVFNILGEATS